MVTKRKLEELRKTAKAHGRDVAIGPHGAVHTVPVPNLRGGVMAKKRKQGRKKRLSLFRTDVRAKIVDRDLLMQHLINIRHPGFIATLRKIVPEWSPSMPWPLSSPLKIPFDTTVDAGVWKIAIDVKDIKACELAASWLRHMIDLHHGPVAVNRIFAENLFSKESLAHQKNIRLMVAYTRSGLSPEKLAIELAEKNKTLPRERKYGPTGTTDPAVLAKQIRRLTKLATADDVRYLKELAADDTRTF